MNNIFLRSLKKKIFSFSTWNGNFRRKVFGAVEYIDPKSNIGPLQNNKIEIRDKLKDYYFNNNKARNDFMLEETTEGKAKLVFVKTSQEKVIQLATRDNLFYNPTLVNYFRKHLFYIKN
jgi:hypothetical protein